MGKKTVFMVCMLLMGATFACSGCAAVNRERAADMENLLSAAGFVSKQPKTPEDLARLEKATPLKLARATRDGAVIYVYPDPYVCKCVYVGTEKEYQEFRRLAALKHLPLQDVEASQSWEYRATGGASEGFWW